MLIQEVIFSAEKRPVFGWNGGRLHIGIRMRRRRSRQDAVEIITSGAKEALAASPPIFPFDKPVRLRL
ncbi:hypothetical protein RFM26_32855 [Mesorhizobium sp. VK23B]|uniref:Uncharacterized protein n=1 Tax=Mesorhizobium dulcispinae TaxID=3072316 RepID=A0ABU4XQ16_9HYPH|nr:hypothetical protein [Mesorhizobium sp. VK23B]MDX8476836.1 hypothetical protein [Mesorhizobium sp. VK23A]